MRESGSIAPVFSRPARRSGQHAGHRWPTYGPPGAETRVITCGPVLAERRHMQAHQLDLDLAAAVQPVVQSGRSRCEARLRAVCPRCGHQATKRLVCPSPCASCSRSSEARARRLRRLLPAVPLRHWTLTLPTELREVLATDDQRVAPLIRAFVEGIFAWYRSQTGVADGTCGAVVVVHRLGSALDRNLHLHVLALDGVFAPKSRHFESAPDPPAAKELARIASTAGAVFSTNGSPRQARASSGSRRVGAGERSAKASGPGRRASVRGVGVFCGSSVGHDDRGARIGLTRYLARPEVEPASMSISEDGRVTYRMRRPGHDGATHVVVPAAELSRRLGPIKPFETGRFRYFGVLAPAASGRWRAVPAQTELIPSPPKRPKPSGWLCPTCKIPMKIATVDELSRPYEPTTLLQHM